MVRAINDYNYPNGSPTRQSMLLDAERREELRLRRQSLTINWQGNENILCEEFPHLFSMRHGTSFCIETMSDYQFRVVQDFLNSRENMYGS